MGTSVLVLSPDFPVFPPLQVIGMGIWRTATSPSGGRGARYVSLSPYIGLPMLWSVYNAIPPFLFCFYCFTSGKPFVRAAGYLRLLGTLAVIGAVFLLWLTVPIEFDMKGATSMAGKYITQQVREEAGVMLTNHGTYPERHSLL